MADVKDDRAFFRLEYPPREQPTITIDRVKYSVRDLSEGGVRFATPLGTPLRVGDQVDASITFRRDQHTIDVEGLVIRLIPYPPQCALKLTKRIPRLRMAEEQRYINRLIMNKRQ